MSPPVNTPETDASDPYESAACGLLTTARDGTIRRANATFRAWTGYSPTELLSRRFQDLLTIGSKLFHQTQWMPLLQMQGSVAEVQLEMVHRDGRVLAVLVNAAQRQTSADRTVDIAVFIATDRRKYERELLVARRRAEQLLDSEREAQAARVLAEARLRLALESAHLRVWTVDLLHGVRHYEPAVASLIGAPELTEVNADAYLACIHPDDRAGEARAYAAAIDPGVRASYSIEYRLLGRDGVERIVRSTGRAFFGPDDVAIQFSGILENVTRRRRAHEKLLQQERDAAQRALFAEQLIGIVSHDLRNPLSAVLLGTQLLGSADPAVQSRTKLRIASAAQRATRLVNDLLDFTQAKLGGGLRVNPREIQLHTVISDYLEEVKLAWPGRTLEHHRVGDGVASVDPDRLAQIITNLGNNALTYGAPETPITFTSVLGDEFAELHVHNAGQPIPREIQAHIFEPMRRGEEHAQPGSRSVGLGLYIVGEIAAAHGGRVRVRSEVGEGTTFIVTLPRHGQQRRG